MKVLVACEESQEVCKAFRAKGHEAYSCDIQEPSGGHLEWHILGDALEAIKGGTVVTMDGASHNVGKWDLLIAHPPCTYLSAAGAVCLFNSDHSVKDRSGYVRSRFGHKNCA
jgi:site-specific DNA-cytosine methylase